MRLFTIVAFCSVAALPVAGQTARTQPPAEEAAVKEIVRQYVDARDKRDAAALSALFTEDADQLVTTGLWRQGRAAVVAGGIASSQGNPGTRQIAIETVRFVAPGVALADGRYEIAGEAGAPPRKMRTTFVVIRDTVGAWRITAIRNMAPTDPALQ